MAHNRDASSDDLTFSQRHGYEPLPEPMQLEHLSKDIRVKIWNAVRELLLEKQTVGVEGKYFVAKDQGFIERVLGRLKKIPEDEIKTEVNQVTNEFRNIVVKAKFRDVLDLLEIIANDSDVPPDFRERVRKLFDQGASAYGLDTSGSKCWFFPKGSKEQGEATRQAIETLRKNNMDSAATHLRKATKHMNIGEWGDSIVDSINAVESVARTIDPEASKTLDPALDSLEKAGLLKHPALKLALKKLYGYTNDEQGLRHCLLDQDSAAVGLDEATFLYGACASFAAYLVNKKRSQAQRSDLG